MMYQMTAAVIGTGFIGPVHVEALRRHGVTVRGILGSSATKSSEAADRLGLSIGYPSLDQILHDDLVDVVHVTSPNRHHFEQVAAIIKAGKHVICEKPLAMNSTESADLVAMAEAANIVAAVNYNVRYYPVCLEAAEQVRAGEIGDTFHVSGSYFQDWLLKRSDFNWRVLAEEGGALRAVADIGTHWLDLIQFVTGQKVVRVFADLGTVYSERDRPLGPSETFAGAGQSENSVSVPINTEDYGNILFHLESGAKGSVTVSQVTAGRKNCLRFEIAGAKSSLAWNSESPCELWVGHRDRSSELMLRDPSLMSERAASRTGYPAGHNEGFPDTFKQLYADVYEYIVAGNFSAVKPFPTFADGHHEILICEAILSSHRQQGWVDVGVS